MRIKSFYVFFLKKIMPVIIFSMGILSIVGTGDDGSNSGEPTKTPPVAVIDSPAGGTIVTQGSAVSFTGTATDSEEKYLQGDALKWTSTLDGDIGFGSSLTRDNLSAGSHTITLTAVDMDGLADSTSVEIIVNPAGNTFPVATINSPTTGSEYNVKDYIHFSGTGSDAEDGWLSGNSLVWSSNIDGQIGIGNSVDTNRLSQGNHTITLKAIDSENTSGVSSISLVIKNTPPIAKIDYPADGSTYQSGASIVFNGTGTDSEDGNLSGTSLVWTASNYGVIGVGANISVDFIPSGTGIIINFTASDKDGLVDTDSIIITIQ